MTLVLLFLLSVQDEAKIDRELKYANDPERPQFQGQAIERLKSRGAKAVPAILDYVKQKGQNGLALFFTEALGEFGDDRIADLLVKCLGDRNFFWRPTAAKALGTYRRKKDLSLFRSLLTDPLWGVRFWSVRALEELDDRGALPELRKLLNDGIYDVRSQAAKTLHAFGDNSGLPVLVASLRSSVKWFEIDYGQIAREDSWKFLKKISGKEFGFKPWEPEEWRKPGLKKWESWMTARDPEWKERVPPNARPQKESGSYLFGFELRSCQRGDFFFRLDDEGALVVGFFNLRRAVLSKEELLSFQEALRKAGEIDRAVPYGEGGCDYEQYYFPESNGRFDRLWIGRGGRPVLADEFIEVVSQLLEKKFDKPTALHFRETTRIFTAQE